MAGKVYALAIPGPALRAPLFAPTQPSARAPITTPSQPDEPSGSPSRGGQEGPTGSQKAGVEAGEHRSGGAAARSDEEAPEAGTSTPDQVAELRARPPSAGAATTRPAGGTDPHADLGPDPHADRIGQAVAFTGGGTRGHVSPNLAIAEALRDRGLRLRFLYFGQRGGQESRNLPADFAFRAVPASRVASWRRPFAFVRFGSVTLYGVLAALRHLARERPAILIASGGFGSIPSALAARLLGIPIYVHEQNLAPGRANRLLARLAQRIGLTFEESRGAFRSDRTRTLGYPLSPSLAQGSAENARKAYGIPPSARVLLVVGGSSGARTINRAIVAALPALLGEHRDLYVLHATGLARTAEYHALEDTAQRVETLRRALDEPEWLARHRMLPFIRPIADAYALADLIVSRAGAGVMMELAAGGPASVLVPKRDVAGQHQLHNARALEASGATRVIEEERSEQGDAVLDPAALTAAVGELLSAPDRRRTMVGAARAFVRPDAARAHAEEVLTLMRPSRASSRSRADEALRWRAELEELSVGEGQSRHSQAVHPLIGRTELGPGRFADLRLPAQAGHDTPRASIEGTNSSGDRPSHRLVIRRGRVGIGEEQLGLGSRELKADDILDFGTRRFAYRLRPEHQETEADFEDGTSSAAPSAARPAPSRQREQRAAAAQRSWSLVGSAAIVTAFGTLASRFFGFLRDAWLAIAFGLSVWSDLWFLGLAVSNALRGVFAEQAVDNAVLPTQVQLAAAGQRRTAGVLWRQSAWAIGVGTSLVAAGVALSAATIVRTMSPRLSETPEMLERAVVVLATMAPYLVFVSLAALASAALRSVGRFAPPAFSPIAFSLGAIAGFATVPWFGAAALGAGVALGGLGQLLWHLPALRERGVRFALGLESQPRRGATGPEPAKTRAPAPATLPPARARARILRVLPFVTAEAIVFKVSGLVDIVLAGRLPTGTIATIGLALVLFRLPTGIIAHAIHTAVLRRASALVGRGDSVGQRALLLRALTWNANALLPITAVLLIAATPAVALVFGHGSFASESVQRVSAVLVAYALGILPAALATLAGRLLAARGENRAATWTAALSVGVNVAASLGLVAAGFGAVGIALGTSLAYAVLAASRLTVLVRRLPAPRRTARVIRARLSFRFALSAGALALAWPVGVGLEGLASSGGFLEEAVAFILPALIIAGTFVAMACVLGLEGFRGLAGKLGPGRTRRLHPSVAALKLASSPSTSTSTSPSALATAPDRTPAPLLGALGPTALLRSLEHARTEAIGPHVEERVLAWLHAQDWPVRNTAVKLAVKLRLEVAREPLCRLATNRTPARRLHRIFGGDFREVGFIRRNALRGLADFQPASGRLLATLHTGLHDPYYEARVAACESLVAHASALPQGLRQRVVRRLEILALQRNFEVAMHAVQALGHLADRPPLGSRDMHLALHPNWRVRAAWVACLDRLERRGLFEDRTLLRAKVDEVLATADGYEPRFELKEMLGALARRLGREEASEPPQGGTRPSVQTHDRMARSATRPAASRSTPDQAKSDQDAPREGNQEA